MLRTVMWLLLVPPCLQADGGTLRLSRLAGNVRVSIFTAPTPLRRGPLDVSVLVQDRVTGAVRLGLPVQVRLAPVDAPEEALIAPATSELATNKLLQAAHLETSTSGRWALEVTVTTRDGPVHLRTEIEVGEEISTWRSLAPWVGFPFGVVAVWALADVLRRRSRRVVEQGM